MNNRDETIREKLLERLSAVDVDARNLAIEVATGSVIVRGSVPTEQQRARTIEALAGAHSIEVLVRPVRSARGAIARPPRDGASSAMDLRDLPQSRPLLPLHDVPAMDRRPLRDLGLVRARRRAVDRETVSFRSSPRAVRTHCGAWPASEGRVGAPERVEPGQGSRTKFEQEQSNCRRTVAAPPHVDPKSSNAS